jgi:hypothetical protein
VGTEVGAKLGVTAWEVLVLFVDGRDLTTQVLNDDVGDMLHALSDTTSQPRFHGCHVHAELPYLAAELPYLAAKLPHLAAELLPHGSHLPAELLPHGSYGLLEIILGGRLAHGLQATRQPGLRQDG